MHTKHYDVLTSIKARMEQDKHVKNSSIVLEADRDKGSLLNSRPQSDFLSDGYSGATLIHQAKFLISSLKAKGLSNITFLSSGVFLCPFKL